MRSIRGRMLLWFGIPLAFDLSPSKKESVFVGSKVIP